MDLDAWINEPPEPMLSTSSEEEDNMGAKQSSADLFFKLAKESKLREPSEEELNKVRFDIGFPLALISVNHHGQERRNGLGKTVQ